MNPWYTVCLVIEAILAVALIVLIVLLHAPKAEGMGGIGGAATIFSGRRSTAEEGIDRVTWVFFTLFMVFCTLLGFGFIRP